MHLSAGTAWDSRGLAEVRPRYVRRSNILFLFLLLYVRTLNCITYFITLFPLYGMFSLPASDDCSFQDRLLSKVTVTV